MGEFQPPAEWVDDTTDWVRLWTLSRDLYSAYLSEFSDLVESGRAEPADLVRFTERCVRSYRCLADLNASLPGLGLTIGQFIDLRDQAISAEQAELERHDRELAENDTEISARYRERQHPTPTGPQSKALATLILNLWLRGLDDKQIGCALDIHDNWPRLVRDRIHTHPGSRAVVAAHLAGRTLGQIAKETGVPASSALRILKLIGEQPHGAAKRVNARARAHDIVKLRDRGLTYKEIADRLGCSMDVVKNTLRRDRRHRYRNR